MNSYGSPDYLHKYVYLNIDSTPSMLDVTSVAVCRVYVTKNWLHNATDILGGYRMLQCVVNLVKKLRTAEENGLPCCVK